MRTKIIILIITVSAMLATSFILFLSKSQKTKSPISEQNTQISPTSAAPSISQLIFKEYTDTAGFKFSYPESITIKTINPNNQKIYSQLALNSDKFSGKIDLKVEDTLISSLDIWLKNNKISTSESEVNNMKLADLKAIEIKTKNKITIAALDQGALFTIDVDLEKNKDFWKEAYQRLISSFTFITPSSTSTSSISESDNSSAGEDVIDEGEEVVE